MAEVSGHHRAVALLMIVLLAACDPQEPLPEVPVDVGWLYYGRDAGGTRYAPLAQIDRSNVEDLEVAWSVSLDDFDPEHVSGREYRFEMTPLVRRGAMYVSTPRGRLLALDPARGEVRWEFDAALDHERSYPEDWTSRGVAGWTDPTAEPGALCAHRIFMAPVDGRIFALDAEEGVLCRNFGDLGVLDPVKGPIASGRPPEGESVPSITSPPIVVGDVLVVGSTMDKNREVAPLAGEVRAFEARTGTLRWTFDPIPRDAGDPGRGEWPEGEAGEVVESAGGNVWSIMSADVDRDLIFLPTSSAAPEHYGGLRPGTNAFANSVVALQASTGEFRWAWQAVHHDLWDYDVAAPPLLIDIIGEEGSSPAVVVGTKTGMLFVLDRRSGEPLFPVDEVPVPSSDVPGEVGWPTQPVAQSPRPLIGDRLTQDSMFGITERDRQECRGILRGLRNEGRYTPPSMRGTLMWPGVWGGINWSGMAWHEERKLVLTTVIRVAMVVQLHDRFEAPMRGSRPSEQVLPQASTPYVATRRPLLSRSGIPCSPPPWSLLVAVDLGDEKATVKWSRPLGTIPGMDLYEDATGWGSLSFGGPLVTAGDLVFVAGSQDDRIRAFDVENGDLLWEHRLPAGGQATPLRACPAKLVA